MIWKSKLSSISNPYSPIEWILETELEACLQKTWTAGQDAARTVNDVGAVENVLHRNEECRPHLLNLVVAGRVPDCKAWDQATLPVRRRLNGIQIIAELTADVNSFDESIEPRRIGVADARVE